MGEPQEDKKHYTEEEFFELVESSELYRRHELVHGEIVDRLGSSANHNSVVMTLGSMLEMHLPDGCRLFGPDVFVKSDAAEGFLVPDLSASCKELHYHYNRKNVITNPELIVEVLSPSTANYDQGEKWGYYQQIASLQDYVLIAQDRPQLALYHRLEDNHWDYRMFHGLEAAITLPSINLSFTLAQIYKRVVFDNPAK